MTVISFRSMLWLASLLVLSYYLYETALTPGRISIMPEEPENIRLLPDMHVQKIRLKKHENHIRIPLDAPGLNGTAGWKALSWVRNKPTWVEPQLFPHLAHHPLLASSLILLKSPDWSTTLAIYPVSTLDANNDLIVITDGQGTTVHANARRVTPDKEGKVYVVVVKATSLVDERKIVQRAVEKARELVGGRKKEEGKVPEFWDGLGICTWESLRAGGGSSRPNHDNLLSLVPDFPIKHFLIDDGWQDVSASRGLASFNPWFGFGGDMASLVKELKSRGVEEVGVWLTLQGYWISIDADSPLIEKYDCQKHHTAKWGQPRGGVNVPLKAGSEWQWLPSAEKAGQFWQDYFSQLKYWGIGFVKVDNQADYDQITSPTAAHVQQAMWSGMLAAAEKTWGSTDHVIMCMSHNERMLNGPGGLGVDRPVGNLVFRNSDDYNAKYARCHQDFIVWNTYSTILTSHLSLVPDFDMFASNDNYPLYHALLRVLTPGPTLLSETPGRPSDMDLLAKMTSSNGSGPARVVKTDTPAAVLSGRWLWDNIQGPGAGPALMASVPIPAVHGALLGIWNVRDPEKRGVVRDRISLQDVRDALHVDELDGDYAVYRWTHYVGSTPQCQIFREGQEDSMAVELGVGEAEMVSIAKVWDLTGGRYAMVGMVGKLAALAGMSVMRSDEGGVAFRTPYHTDGLRIVGSDSKGPLRVSIRGEDSVIETEQSIAEGVHVFDIPLRRARKQGLAGDALDWSETLLRIY